MTPGRSAGPRWRPGGARVEWWALGLALTTPACAEWLDIPAEPRLVPSGPWRCLEESAAEPDTVELRPAVARVRVQVCDFVSNCVEPVTGLTARLCEKRDVGCANPVQAGLADSGGEFELSVATAGGGFDGYLLLEPPLAPCDDPDVFGPEAGALCALLPGCALANDFAAGDAGDPARARPSSDPACQLPTHAPGLVFFNPPVTRDRLQPTIVPLLKARDLSAVVTAAGAPFDPTRGNLFITALDCDGRPAAGVTYEMIANRDPAALPLYVQGGVVSDDVFVTDASGVGGFVGVQPGFVQLGGFTQEGQRIGEVGLQSVPFTIAYSVLGGPAAPPP